MNLFLAGLFSLILIAAPTAQLTINDLAKYATGQEDGMCASHLVSRIHVEIGGKKSLVFVSPDTNRIIILLFKGDDYSDPEGAILSIGTVGKGGVITITASRAFDIAGLDAGGPCPQMYPEKS